MKTRLLTLLIALATNIGFVLASSSVAGIWYNFNSSSRTAEVIYRGSSAGQYDEYSGAVVIPSAVTYKSITYSVTSIGPGAFSGCRGLTSITIPNSVTSIGDYAFYDCSSLASVTIPNSVISVGDRAFYSCIGLTSVTIPNNVTSIGNYAFYSCRGLTSITIPNSVTSIGYHAFDNCSGLTSVIILNSATGIGNSAFIWCSSLTSVTFGNSVTSIGDYTFEGCIGLTSITIPNSVTSIGQGAFSGCSGLTSITIPNSVASIGNYAFRYCSGLTSVIFGNSLTSIGDHAFESCSGLTSITIPNSVTSIGWEVFGGCSGLTSVTINADAILSSTNNYDMKKIFGTQVTNYIIGNDVTSIGNNVFKDCTNLISISISNSVTSIDSSAFSGCSGLTSITIPNSVTSIGSYAFSGCGGLTFVTIGNSVTSIGNYAFSGCSGLTSVTTPNRVTSIGNHAFDGCSGLTSVIFGNRLTSIGEYAFHGCTGLTTITIPNSVTSIGRRAFMGCSGLTSITIPNSVTSIGERAFYNCSGLTSITIPNSVTSIGDYAFYGCSGLTSVTIPNSVTSIGNYAFSWCSGLTSISIPNSVTSIGNYAFRFCNGLTSVTIDNSATSIGQGAFSGCGGLTSITIPNSVTSIGADAFSRCSNLKTVTLNSMAFYSAKNTFGDQVTSYIIGDSVITIGNNAFKDCTQLTDVTIGKSVTGIYENAFSGCTNLTTVTLNSNSIVGNNYSISSASMGKWFGAQVAKYIIGEDVTRIGSNAFYPSCDNVSMVIIGSNVTYIGQAAFFFCKNMSVVSVLAETPPVLSSIVFTTDVTCWFGKRGKIYVPCGTLSAYQNSWSAYENYLQYDPTPLFTTTASTNIVNAGNVTILNTACETILEVTNNHGYSFTQWSDGVTDNPRTLVLTQDTTFVAEFAINQYSINVSCDETYGYIEGENGIFDYRTTHSYEAVPNYGYHFTQWSDGVTDNPRTLVLTQDTTFVAEFAVNQYSINVSCGRTYGYIEGSSGTFDYQTTHTYEAIANYGYHFTQWSDGVTDNPRTLVLTQDTTFVAEFAVNQYSINVSCNETYGHVEGEFGNFDYRTTHSYEAVPNYGYHFTQWSDGVTDNPRTITITKDESIEAVFEKNTYAINDRSNYVMGSISSVSQAEYLDSVTLTAISNYGYHFSQWSDGKKENPRMIVLTQDTTFIAEFAVDKSGSCGKNNLLRWTFSDDGTLTISGSGELTENYTYGVEAPTQMKSFVIGEGIMAIGDGAFLGCDSLTKVDVYNLATWCNTEFTYISCPLRTADLYINGTKPTRIDIPEGVTNVGAYAFMNCKLVTDIVLASSVTEIGEGAFSRSGHLQTITLDDALETIGDSAFASCPYLITVNANMVLPPLISASVFANCGLLSGIDCYVPQGSLALYQKTAVWNSFNLHEKETDLKSTQAVNNATQTQKVFKNGKLYILMPDGTRYDATGRKVE